VVLLPFSTGMYVQGFGFSGAFVFYCINLICIGLFNFLLIHNVYKKEKTKSGLTPILVKWLKFRALNVVFVWVLSMIFASVLPLTSRLLFVLIFIFQFIGDRYFKKRMT